MSDQRVADQLIDADQLAEGERLVAGHWVLPQRIGEFRGGRLAHPLLVVHVLRHALEADERLDIQIGHRLEVAFHEAIGGGDELAHEFLGARQPELRVVHERRHERAEVKHEDGGGILCGLRQGGFDGRQRPLGRCGGRSQQLDEAVVKQRDLFRFGEPGQPAARQERLRRLRDQVFDLSRHHGLGRALKMTEHRVRVEPELRPARPARSPA